MTGFLNRVRVVTATTGTGSPIALGAAFSDAFCTPDEAGAVDGTEYTYVIEQGEDFEIQKGAWTDDGNIFRNTPVLSKIGGTAGTDPIDLDGTATVRFIVSAEDLAPLVDAEDWGLVTSSATSTDDYGSVA